MLTVDKSESYKLQGDPLGVSTVLGNLPLGAQLEYIWRKIPLGFQQVEGQRNNFEINPEHSVLNKVCPREPNLPGYY